MTRTGDPDGPVTVECEYTRAPGGGEAPASWAQQFMWEVVRAAGVQCAAFDFVVVRDLPGPGGVPAAVDLLRAFLLRHPILRTAIVAGPDGGLVQRVRAAGTVPVAVRGAPIDPADLRDAIPGSTDEEPVGALVVAGTDGSVRLALRISHLATDGWGIRILAEDLQAPPRTAPVTTSPLEVARFERSGDGAAVQQRALAHATAVYAACPPTMWPGPRRSPEAERFWYGELRSSELLVAMDELIRRKRLRRAGILTGLLAAVTAASAGLDSALLFTISSNRFEEAWRAYPGQLSQEAILHLPVLGTLEETMRTALAGVMRSLLAARYSTERMREACRAAAWQRGVCFDGVGSAVVLNLRTGEPSRRELPAGRRPMTFSWTGSTAAENLGFFLDAFETEDEFVLAARVDTARLSPAAAERWLRTIEWAVVTDAARDVTQAELRERLRPDGMPGSWPALVAGTERVVAAATGARAVRVEPAPAEVAGPAYVCYLAAPRLVGTPEEAHRAVMAALPAAQPAVAPAEYVIVAAEPAGGTAWAELPVLAGGTGRGQP